MLQFVDSFYCAYNTQKGNYVIKLRQEEPIEKHSRVLNQLYKPMKLQALS